MKGVDRNAKRVIVTVDLLIRESPAHVDRLNEGEQVDVDRTVLVCQYGRLDLPVVHR